MGRPRTVNHDLPRNVGRDTARRLRYRRPDTQRYVSLHDLGQELALRLAAVLNRAFGPRPARGERHRYAESFRRFDWTTVDTALREAATAKCPDLMPFEAGSRTHERLRHSWAFARPQPAAMMDGLAAISPWEAKHPERLTWVARLYATARRNAAARGIPFTLSIDDLRAVVRRSGGHCEVSGLPLSVGSNTSGKFVRRPWAPSLDRIDSTGGYTADNCRLVCCAVNFAMSAWGEDVLVEIAKAIARKRIARTLPTTPIGRF